MTASPPSEPASSGRSAKLGIALACVVGAIVAYVLLSRPAPATPQDLEAAKHAEAVRASVEQSAPEPPPEPTRSPRRGLTNDSPGN